MNRRELFAGFAGAALAALPSGSFQAAQGDFAQNYLTVEIASKRIETGKYKGRLAKQFAPTGHTWFTIDDQVVTRDEWVRRGRVELAEFPNTPAWMDGVAAIPDDKIIFSVGNGPGGA